MAWHLPRRLTLPANEPGELTLAGTDLVVDLARLCVKGGGSVALDDSGGHVAMSLQITSGR